MNTQSKVINGIWGSEYLVPKQAGYLSFDMLPANHQPTWMDISFENAFGANLPPLTSPRARHLKYKDPTLSNAATKATNYMIKPRTSPAPS
jgi:hypothetical protein